VKRMRTAGAPAHGLRVQRARTAAAAGMRDATPRDMRTFGFGAALLVSLLLLLVVWLVSRAAGLHISLLASVALTVLLTIIVNVIAGATARRHRWQG